MVIDKLSCSNWYDWNAVKAQSRGDTADHDQTFQCVLQLREVMLRKGSRDPGARALYAQIKISHFGDSNEN